MRADTMVKNKERVQMENIRRRVSDVHHINLLLRGKNMHALETASAMVKLWLRKKCDSKRMKS